jgi:hypothetical protein
MKVLRFLLYLCSSACASGCFAPAYAQCPPRTAIAETVYNADGSPAEGRLVIAWQTFSIGACQVAAGQTTVSVTAGALNVQLYPNTTAVPAGTSYRATYYLKSGRITTEYWVVPVSATPVNLAAIRSATVPVPNVMFSQSQVTNLSADLGRKVELPSPCPAGKYLQANGAATAPQVDCVDGTTGGGGGSGTVTSVGLSLPAQFSVSGSPVTASGTLAATWQNQGANLFLAGPATGAAAAPGFRALADADVPDTISLADLTQVAARNYSDLQNIPSTFAPAAHALDGAAHTASGLTAGHYLKALSATSFGFVQINFADIAGAVSDAQVPNNITIDLAAEASALAADPADCSGNDFARGINASGTAQCAQPAFSNLSGTIAGSQQNNPAVGVKGGVEAKTCSGTDKLSAIGTDGVPVCSADQSGGGGSSHELLSATHTDTTAAAVARGSGMFGIGASPTWTRVDTTTTDRYFKRNSSGDIVESSNPAAGTGSPTSCSNQVVTGFTLNADAAPTSTCTTLTKSFLPGTVVHTDQTNTYSGTTTQDFGASTTTLVLPKKPDPASPTAGEAWVNVDAVRVQTNGTGIYARTATMLAADVRLAARYNAWYVCEYFNAFSGCMETATSNGTGASTGGTTSTSDEPGMVQSSTGTTATGRTKVALQVDSVRFGSGQWDWFHSLEDIPNLSTSAQRYYFFSGFHDQTGSGFPVDGVYILYDEGGTGGTASANWQCGTSNNSTRTHTASSTAVSTGAHTLYVTVNGAGTEARFYVDGTELSCSPITTNIPTASGRETRWGWGLEKTVGTTARTINFGVHAMLMQPTNARW